MQGAGIIPLLWRSGRVVEGTPLLRAHLGKTWIEGSNPSFSAKYLANKRPTGRFVFLPPMLPPLIFSLAAISGKGVSPRLSSWIPLLALESSDEIKRRSHRA